MFNVVSDLVANFAIVISAAIALLGVLFSAAISAIVSRRSAYINAVTVERSKWIEKLRSNLAEFCALTGAVDLEFFLLNDLPKKEVIKKVSSGSAVREIRRLECLIRMQLNPRGEIDKNVIFLLEEVSTVMFTIEKGKLSQIQQLILLHSQWLLKQEWEKVKTESGGTTRRIISFIRELARKQEYREFCNSEAGSIAQFQTQSANQQDLVKS